MVLVASVDKDSNNPCRDITIRRFPLLHVTKIDSLSRGTAVLGLLSKWIKLCDPIDDQHIEPIFKCLLSYDRVASPIEGDILKLDCLSSLLCLSGSSQVALNAEYICIFLGHF